MHQGSNETILATIGNTPLVRLQHVVPQAAAAVYVKLEYVNPTGSYKDRMALAVIDEAEKRGDLKPGMTVVECTAGNTGTALAAICSLKGYPFKVVSSDAFAKDKLQAMRVFGADVDLVPSDGGKITPDLLPRMIRRAQELSEQPNTYWTRQFQNKDIFAGTGNIALEILEQVPTPVTVFCAAAGTAGMFAGVARVLKKANTTTKVIVLEPASAPLLSKGETGTHSVDGIAPGFVPPLLQEIQYDEARGVDERAARNMAKRLAREEGIFAGVSTGLNVEAAVNLAQELGAGNTVVTVACDSGMKYLSTGLFD